MKPWIHAQRSVGRYGGKIEDYIEVHEFMDISKGAIADNRHRTLTHNSWFIMHILPRIFGPFLVNGDGRKVAIRQLGEDHALEDFKGKFIPTACDFLQEMSYQDWMQNGQGVPPSARKLMGAGKKRTINMENWQ